MADKGCPERVELVPPTFWPAFLPDKLTYVGSKENIIAESFRRAPGKHAGHSAETCAASRAGQRPDLPDRCHVLHFSRLSCHGAAAANVHAHARSHGGNISPRQPVSTA